MMNDTITVMKERRSIRRFSPLQVEEDKLQVIR